MSPFRRLPMPSTELLGSLNLRWEEVRPLTLWVIWDQVSDRLLQEFMILKLIDSDDLRYQILTVALCKVGHSILLISPRNSIEGDLNVIDKSSCSTWLVPSQYHRFQNIAKIFAARKNMRVVQVPEASELLDQAPVRSYPFNKTFKEAEKDPLMVLHSSGSTGKTIIPMTDIRLLA